MRLTEILIFVFIFLLFTIESIAVVLAVITSVRFPSLGKKWFARCESALAIVAAHRGACVAGVGLLALAARMAVLPAAPVPEPGVHDEFSYLLAADTFASGRMANPTHPFWEHFESFHIEHQPTYASMYPPGQGATLAVGRRVFGHSFWGVWLSVGAMCAAVCWMLQGWLPPFWALAGALLAVVRIGMFSYWADSYWGGAVAATGGALVLGAVPRIIRTTQTRHALIFACGIAMLLNSRPYEGGITSAAACAVLSAALLRRHVPFGTVLRRVALPAVLVLAPVAAGVVYYNWRVFGNPLTLPYSLNRRMYASTPVFLFEKMRPALVYRHEVLRAFYGDFERKHFEKVASLSGFLWLTGVRLTKLSQFFAGPALTVPLLLACPAIMRRRLRGLLWILAVVSAALSLQAFFAPHYAAPITALVLGLLIEGFRRLRLWKRHSGTGLALSRWLALICVLMIFVRIGAAFVPGFNLTYPLTWGTVWCPKLQRGEIAHQLSAQGGTHLVLVRYRPGHDPFYEYVYNDADIDRSPIVWAREMTPKEDRRLIRYFNNRKVWLFEADAKPPNLTRYPDSGGP